MLHSFLTSVLHGGVSLHSDRFGLGNVTSVSALSDAAIYLKAIQDIKVSNSVWN
jgi:hypothetical protein